MEKQLIEYIDYYESHIYKQIDLKYEQLNEYYKDFIKRHYNIQNVDTSKKT